MQKYFQLYTIRESINRKNSDLKADYSGEQYLTASF